MTEVGKPEELPFKVVTPEELTTNQVKAFARAKAPGVSPVTHTRRKSEFRPRELGARLGR